MRKRKSERSGARERRKQCGLRSKGASELCERVGVQANGRASGLVLTSGFLVDLAHCEEEEEEEKEEVKYTA